MLIKRDLKPIPDFSIWRLSRRQTKLKLFQTDKKKKNEDLN